MPTSFGFLFNKISSDGLQQLSPNWRLLRQGKPSLERMAPCFLPRTLQAAQLQFPGGTPGARLQTPEAAGYDDPWELQLGSLTASQEMQRAALAGVGSVKDQIQPVDLSRRAPGLEYAIIM